MHVAIESRFPLDGVDGLLDDDYLFGYVYDRWVFDGGLLGFGGFGNGS